MNSPNGDVDPNELDPTDNPNEVPEPSDPDLPEIPIELPQTELPESDPFEDQNFPL